MKKSIILQGVRLLKVSVLPLTFGVLILGGLSSCSSTTPSRGLSGELRGSSMGQGLDPEKGEVEPEPTIYTETLRRQQHELDRQRREIEELRRQKYYDRQLRRFEDPARKNSSMQEKSSERGATTYIAKQGEPKAEFYKGGTFSK